MLWTENGFDSFYIFLLQMLNIVLQNLIVNHANFMNSYKPTIAPLPPSPPSPPPYPPSPPYPPFDGPMPPKLGFSLFEDSFPSGWQEGSWTGGFSVTSYGDEPSVVRVQVSGWGAFTFTSDDAPAAGSNAFSSALYGEASNAPVAISLWMHMPTYSSRGKGKKGEEAQIVSIALQAD